ncbi:proteasome accessory factor [Corynebacterium kutscheri]|uniref:Pup--protein ligase n=1 Tax=Corynebacterium kutscheri TaxID=35755 RepID=A0A0F6QZJ9_9CORY|nr:Pup--protein ligase [Corynebacterium kutscheri]AKE41212.1 Pup--protein ligase [Corynebacterium kutscheri]VEH08488.1 proteasome accessory factor [Corynebacterium kutscheri]VEH09534.1 proteasome accessory factor [Corynebacterium kutscheri]VEH79617.1 proteasome accessory factor [Corynebacterium kutscheri]
MSAFTRRITGIETEYGITCISSSGKKCLDPDEIARIMFRPIIKQWGSSNVFVPNASRLYLDVGSHPEIATAECDSLSQLIAYDQAGDRIVDELARTAEKTLAKEGTKAAVYLFKNNLDSQGNSYGCHENYLVSRETVLKTLGKQLLPFLITRQLIAGAGCIKNGQFHFSQRADHVWEGVSSATTRSRPIINTRDEPHADSHLYRRLHVIVGDSSLCEATTALKIGSTLLVLEMIEAEYQVPAIELDNEIAAIREISRDLSGATTVALKGRDPMSALDIQRHYLNAARQWLSVRDDSQAGTSNNELELVVTLWEKTLTAIASGDISTIATEIDWAIKLQLLRRYQQRLGTTDFSHPKLAQIDLTYHDIRPGRGLFKILEEKNAVRRWVVPADIEFALNHAPQTTRAKLRGEFIRAAQETAAPVSIDWLRLKVSRPEPQIIELSNPFSAVDQHVDELIDYMHTHRGHYRDAESLDS